MPCVNTAPTRSAIKRLRKKAKKKQNKNSTVKTQYLNLKAPSHNVKM